MALGTRLQQAKQLDMKTQNGLNQSQRQSCPENLKMQNPLWFLLNPRRFYRTQHWHFWVCSSAFED